jgi:S1-C subfamily serine protease
MPVCRTIHLLFLLLLLLHPNHSASAADELGAAVQAAIQKVEPSIVRLRVIGGEQSIDGDSVKSLVTTGVVISEDGEILTSQFALEGNPEAILIEDQSGKRTNATIVATDSVRRIVLLKAKEGRWIPAVTEEDPPVEIGQWAIALGRFYSAESSSVAVGIISALNRIHGMAIQTDAKISPVNYGGPLVTLNGRIAGILVPLSPQGGGSPNSGVEWYDSGIGFAIPLKDALQAAEKLRAGKNLKPGRLGLRLKPAGAFDSDIVIDRVLPGSPSATAELLKGDRILAVDEQIVDRSSVLMEIVARHYAGDNVTFRIRRGEQEISTSLVLAETLTPVPHGYLGLLPIRLAKKAATTDVPTEAKEKNAPDDAEKKADEQPPLDIPQIKLPEILQKKSDGSSDDSDSVPLVVLNDLPAAAANIPVGIEILSVNDAATKSPAELAVALEELVPESVVKIEFRLPGESEKQTAEIKASVRPETVVELSDAVLDQIQKSRPSSAAKMADTPDKAEELPETNSSANGVARQEFNFAERGRCVVLSSSLKSPVSPGIVILLSAHETSEEEIVRLWGPILKSHCLSVIVPQNPESAKLTTEDIPLVMTTIRAVVSKAGADLRRVFVVADRSQSALAWECTFGGPSPIRGIALTDGWFANSEIQGSEGAGLSVLLLDQTPSTTAKALRELSLKSLTEAGFWAPLPTAKSEKSPDDEQKRAVRCIGDWSLQTRSF